MDSQNSSRPTTDRHKDRTQEVIEDRQSLQRSDTRSHFTPSPGFERAGHSEGVQALSALAAKGFTEGWTTPEQHPPEPPLSSSKSDVPTFSSQPSVEPPLKKRRVKRKLYQGEGTFTIDMSETTVGSHARKTQIETMGPKGISNAFQKRLDTMGPESLHEAAKKGKRTMGPERLTEARKKQTITMGEEGYRKAAQKAMDTIAANKAFNDYIDPSGGGGSSSGA